MVKGMALTKVQERVYLFIRNCKNRYGYPPTIREIATGLGFKSANNVRQHLRLIERKGYLTVASGKARGIEMKTQFGGVSFQERITVPLYGRVAAGTPLVAEENIEGSVTLDRSLFKGDGLFTLRVKGESMRDIGVLDGDIAVVKQQFGAANGEVVVAIVEGEATLKRFFKKDDRIILHAENPDYHDIVIASPKNVFIAGRLLGVIRRY